MKLDFRNADMKFYIKILVIALAVIWVINVLIQNIASVSPEKVFTRYIKFQRLHDYKKAYSACFSSGYRKKMDFQTFKKLQNEHSAALGFAINKEIVSTEALKDEKGHDIYIIMSLGLYPTGVSPENYIFVRELKGWRIDSFDVMSHLLDNAERRRMKDFIKGMPEEAQESYRRMLEAEGRSIK